jgi:hypothetical protein
MTQWLQAIVHDRPLSPDARVAAELVAETLIGQRLFWEATRK